MVLEEVKMGTVLLIGTVAILVALVGAFVIWRLDARRAEEIEEEGPVINPAHTRKNSY